MGKTQGISQVGEGTVETDVALAGKHHILPRLQHRPHLFRRPPPSRLKLVILHHKGKLQGKLSLGSLQVGGNNPLGHPHVPRSPLGKSHYRSRL